MSVIDLSLLPGPPEANVSTHSFTQDKGLLGTPPPPILSPRESPIRESELVILV